MVILIILYLVYLLSFFFLSLFLRNSFFSFSFFFLYTFFFEKSTIFYFLHLKYLSLCTWSIYIFFLFLSSFFCNWFFILFLFFLYMFIWKIIWQRLRKMCFIVVIVTLSYFSTTLKISLRSYMFLLLYMIFIIFYYI